MSRSYEPMTCACGLTIEPRPQFVEKVGKASSYATCVYRCSCGLGYSNGAVAAKSTRIANLPARNVPSEVTNGLEEVLAASLNVRNRTAKREKFCFSTSEDAVTWTLFSFLTHAELLGLVPLAAGLERPAGEPELLLWGAPVHGGEQVHLDLVAVCDDIREDPRRRSEPDAIIAWPKSLVFVEVKYRSSNDVKPGYQNFGLYTDRADIFALPPERVAAAGYYELVRNWRIGSALAERSERSFAIINLGPRGLAARTPDLAGVFKAASGRTFASLSWADLLGLVSSEVELPEWLSSFISERELDSNWA